MALLRRFCAHWPELAEHLKEDQQVPSKRDLALRPTDAGAAKVSLDECRHLLDLELAGSGSLNTRGTQLAGLTGATIALVATLTKQWLGSIEDPTRTWLGVLIIAAMVALFGSMYCAIFAVLPTSRWRKALANTLVNELASKDEINDAALCREMAQKYLTMVEDQRVRNQAKADDMLLSYGFLAVGVVVLLAAAVIFISSQIN